MAVRSGYDLLLGGGRVICPASGVDGLFDVAIRDGRIAAVEPRILPNSAKETVDVSGKLVLPGLIDTHAHVDQYVTGRFGLNADIPREHADDDNHPFKGQPRFGLTQAMSSMMALGLPLETVVPMATSNAAGLLGLSDRIGALKPGFEADVTVLRDDRGRFLQRDNEVTRVVADRLLRPDFCLRGGRRFDADSPILPAAVAA